MSGTSVVSSNNEGAVHCRLNQEDGFALVVVLWLLGVLSLIAITVSFSVGLEIKTTANVTSRLRTELLADGFVRLVLADIAQTRRFTFGKQPLASGVPFACDYKGRRIVVTVTDTKGLLDLNTGDPEQLRRLIMSAGLDEPRVETLIAAISDYRDPDNDAQGGGTETNRYASAGLIHLPKNAPFESVEELDQVFGLPGEVLPVLRQYLTVRSYDRAVQGAAASPQLLYALEGGSPSMSELVSHVQAVNSRNAADETPYSFEPTSRAFEVRLLAAAADGAKVVRHAVVEITPGRNLGFTLHQWKNLPEFPIEAAMAQASQSATCHLQL